MKPCRSGSDPSLADDSAARHVRAGDSDINADTVAKTTFQQPSAVAPTDSGSVALRSITTQQAIVCRRLGAMCTHSPCARNVMPNLMSSAFAKNSGRQPYTQQQRACRTSHACWAMQWGALGADAETAPEPYSQPRLCAGCALPSAVGKHTTSAIRLTQPMLSTMYYRATHALTQPVLFTIHNGAPHAPQSHQSCVVRSSVDATVCSHVKVYVYEHICKYIIRRKRFYYVFVYVLFAIFT